MKWTINYVIRYREWCHSVPLPLTTWSKLLSGVDRPRCRPSNDHWNYVYTAVIRNVHPVCPWWYVRSLKCLQNFGNRTWTLTYEFWEFLINVLHTYTFLSTLYYDYSVQFFKKTCKYSTFVLCNNLACVNVTIDTATKNYCCLGCIAASSCILHSNTVRSSRRFSLNVHLSLQTQLWRLARKWKMKFSVLLQGRTRRWLYHPQILLNQM